MSRINQIGLNGGEGLHYLIKLDGMFYKNIKGIIYYYHKYSWREAMRQDWDYYLTNGEIVIDYPEELLDL
jgi:hypothetical protein